MADTKQKKSIEKLYEALKKKKRYVARVCGDQPPEDPLHSFSDSCNDTFLHTAIRFKQNDLVRLLLEKLSKDDERLLSNIINNEGNTILHELACSDSMKNLAEKVLKNCKDNDQMLLLTARNKFGETPIFCAARHGQTEMFKFLAKEMKLKVGSEKDVMSLPEDMKLKELQELSKSQHHLQRDDKTTVLHISITTECFELACFIASTYSYLIEEKDQESMTALQYLSCNPTAFGKNMKMRQRVMEELMISLDPFKELKNNLKKIFNMCTSKDNTGNGDTSMTSYERCSPILQELVKLLVEKDTSWHASINSQEGGPSNTKKEVEIEHSSELFLKGNGQESLETEGQNPQKNKGQNSNNYKKSDETPLFLATISNIKEIVEEILICHPKELEHTNWERMNILQVAILYRQKEIFDMLVKSEVLPRDLFLSINEEGNSLLHMVGQNTKSQASEKMQNPAFQLRNELLLFQKVKSDCKMHLTKPLNNNHQTAEELFAASNEKLHQEAKEWLMRTGENCTLLSVFIATVAFAAAYTVPGGPDQNTGIPILNCKPFFVVFIIADVISLTLALTSVGIFLTILQSSFLLEDFKKYLFEKLIQGIICLMFSVLMMAVAFGATIILIMKHNWKKAVWHVVAFLPVPIFFLSYSPLRSVVLIKKLLKKVFKPIKVAGLVGLIILLAVIIHICRACRKLFNTVAKACEYKFQPKSDTQSPQQTAAPGTEV